MSSIKDISKVLIVNDSTSEQALISDMLIIFHTKIVENEFHLFNVLSSWEPNIIIMNNVLIDSDGYTLAEKIRSNSNFDYIPIILTASQDHPVDIQRAYEVGCNSYLNKPFSKEKLLDTFSSFGSKHRSISTNLLIVEDSRAIRTIISAPFMKNQYVVEEAENGEHALEILKTFTPDVMTVDIDMPKMDGLTLCDRVRKIERLKDVPVVVISGTIDHEIRSKGYEVGAIEFFQKPFSSEDIFYYIDQLVESLRSDNDVKILVVEDSPMEQHIIKFALMRGGYRPYVIPSGEEAIELANNVEFDLILMDILLEGQDGLSTCRMLKENPKTRDIAIIMVTGITDSILQSFDVGANDYIGKPFSTEELVSRVKINLDKALSVEKQKSYQLSVEKNFEYNVKKQDMIIKYLINYINDLVIIIDSSAALIYCNNALIELTGSTEKQLKEENWIKILFQELVELNYFTEWLKEASEGSGIRERQLDISINNFKKTSVSWSIFLLKDINEDIEAYFIVGKLPS